MKTDYKNIELARQRLIASMPTTKQLAQNFAEASKVINQVAPSTKDLINALSKAEQCK